MTTTPSEIEPEGAADAQRSAAAVSVALGVGSESGAAEEHPASSRADSAAADRAAIGRMRTVNLKMTGEGEASILPHLSSVQAENSHADTGMESGVPSTGDFRCGA